MSDRQATIEARSQAGGHVTTSSSLRNQYLVTSGSIVRILFLALLAGIYALIAIVSTGRGWPAFCPFRRITGLRCPLCGGLNRGQTAGVTTLRHDAHGSSKARGRALSQRMGNTATLLRAILSKEH